MDVHDFTKMFWDYSKKINDHIHFAFQPIFNQHGITLLQARILVEIYGQGQHTIGSLANSINMAGTNISTMCKKLENMELVRRVRDSKDERIVNVVLTLKGEDIVESFNEEVIERVSIYMKLEPERNLQDIIKGLQELEKLLQHIAKTE
jgi:MarR family transcriptional regulator, organic hydroperoxide resistance regulator